MYVIFGLYSASSSPIARYQGCFLLGKIEGDHFMGAESARCVTPEIFPI